MIYRSNGNHIDFDDDAGDSQGKHSRVRLTIFAFVMICALLGGMIVQAGGVIPTLLGYWRSDYRLTFTEVSLGDCNRYTDRLLCVCGRLDAQQGDADFDIRIRTQEGASLGKITLHDQPSGSFCHVLRLTYPLEPGDYVLIGTPRFSRDTIARAFFTVPDNRPTF